jgi:hypothetical protein
MTIAAVGFSDDSKRPRVKGTINGTAVQFLVDSGASISVVSERTFDGIWGAAGAGMALVNIQAYISSTLRASFNNFTSIFGSIFKHF